MSARDDVLLAQVDAVVARLLAAEVDRLTALLLHHGATTMEVEEEVTYLRATWATHHKANRAEMARVLSDPSAPTGALQ